MLRFVPAERSRLATCAAALPGDLIIVSNEVAMGLVPAYPLGCAFRDVVGRANQDLDQKAKEVCLPAAGIQMTPTGS